MGSALGAGRGAIAPCHIPAAGAARRCLVCAHATGTSKFKLNACARPPALAGRRSCPAAARNSQNAACDWGAIRVIGGHSYMQSERCTWLYIYWPWGGGVNTGIRFSGIGKINLCLCRKGMEKRPKFYY